MPAIDTLTGTKVKETYTKLLQINSDNELLDGIGGEVSPILKSGATITGSLDVQGTILQNGIAVGGAGQWSINAESEVYVDKNVGIGTENPSAKIEIESTHASEDFFIIKKTTVVGDSATTKTVFKVNNDGTMVLGAETSAPTAEKGGIYYNGSDNEFYLGYEE